MFLTLQRTPCYIFPIIESFRERNVSYVATHNLLTFSYNRIFQMKKRFLRCYAHPATFFLQYNLVDEKRFLRTTQFYLFPIIESFRGRNVSYVATHILLHFTYNRIFQRKKRFLRCNAHPATFFLQQNLLDEETFPTLLRTHCYLFPIVESFRIRNFSYVATHTLLPDVNRTVFVAPCID